MSWRLGAANRTRGLSRTSWTLAALAAGLAFGTALNGSSAEWVGRFAEALAPAGRIWIAALEMVVVPLVITQTFVAIVRAPAGQSVGVLGTRTLLLFLVVLLAAGVLTLALAPPLISMYPSGADAAASLRAAVSIPAAAPRKESAADFGSWLVNLVPRNLVQSASSGEILPVLLATVLFAVAVRRLSAERRELLSEFVAACSDATMVLVGWVLKLAPFGVFVLAFELAVRAGIRVAGFLGVFLAVDIGLMLLFLVLLYPVTALAARVSIARFARAVAPAQLVAASTRSSLASLPALVDGAKRHLGLPPLATGFVLPLSVSTFKANRPISGIVKVLFLAHVFHVHLGARELAAFLATTILISFSTAGIPDSGVSRMLPAYLAAGVPLEGVVILGTIAALPDVFKTVTNVTADMSAAAILSRSARPQAVASPERALSIP